jgi:alkylated DNA nucleotide flippase Atl1
MLVKSGSTVAEIAVHPSQLKNGEQLPQFSSVSWWSVVCSTGISSSAQSSIMQQGKTANSSI